MARVVLENGLIGYDEYSDLRGDVTQKNIEKAFGPEAIQGAWHVRRCPLCNCVKSFHPAIPNSILFGCDGDCPCHDGIEST